MNAQRSQPAAIMGTFADFALVKTRKIARFVVEIPIEEADAALKALGGLPRSDGERWVAVALLKSKPGGEPIKGGDLQESRTEGDQNQPRAKERRPWDTMTLAAQAGLLCGDPRFQDWLDKNHGEIWTFAAASSDDRSDVAAAVVRVICGVPSRRDLDKGETAALKWARLITDFRAATGQMAEIR